MSPQQAFSEALHRAGSQAALASIVGKRQPAISKRLSGSCRAEPDEVLAIERNLGVSRHLLRPDIYPLDTTVTGSLSLSHDGGDVANGASMVAFNRSAVLPFEAGND